MSGSNFTPDMIQEVQQRCEELYAEAQNVSKSLQHLHSKRELEINCFTASEEANEILKENDMSDGAEHMSEFQRNDIRKKDESFKKISSNSAESSDWRETIPSTEYLEKRKDLEKSLQSIEENAKALKVLIPFIDDGTQKADSHHQEENFAEDQALSPTWSLPSSQNNTTSNIGSGFTNGYFSKVGLDHFRNSNKLKSKRGVHTAVHAGDVDSNTHGSTETAYKERKTAKNKEISSNRKQESSNSEKSQKSKIRANSIIRNTTTKANAHIEKLKPFRTTNQEQSVFDYREYCSMMAEVQLRSYSGRMKDTPNTSFDFGDYSSMLSKRMEEIERKREGAEKEPQPTQGIDRQSNMLFLLNSDSLKNVTGNGSKGDTKVETQLDDLLRKRRLDCKDDFNEIRNYAEFLSRTFAEGLDQNCYSAAVPSLYVKYDQSAEYKMNETSDKIIDYFRRYYGSEFVKLLEEPLIDVSKNSSPEEFRDNANDMKSHFSEISSKSVVSKSGPKGSSFIDLCTPLSDPKRFFSDNHGKWHPSEIQDYMIDF